MNLDTCFPFLASFEPLMVPVLLQVKKLVSEEMFVKYDKLLLQTSLDMMLDVTYCPRPACRAPVLMEKDSTMACCPVCSFAFCTLCKLVYHGLSPCKLKAGMILHGF